MRPFGSLERTLSKYQLRMNQMNSSKGVLNDQVAIITGVSSGLGRATALAFAKAGARVALIARREEELVSVATEIEADGGQALVLPLDLAQGNENYGSSSADRGGV
jgi:NADP-dependent 3-hydroxy acid dehydrogenase YdfG